MKKLLPTLLLIVLSALAISAQVNPSISAANPAPKDSVNKTDATAATRARVLGAPSKSSTTGGTANNQILQAHSKGNFKNRARLESLGAAVDDAKETAVQAVAENTSPINIRKDPAPVVVAEVKPAAVTTSNAASFPVVSAASSQIYRVGVGDVLDIKLNYNAGPESTLFTVIGGGMLEYPLAGITLPVAGLTTAEIAALLKQKIKLFENPEVAVSVRDFASHNVTISGLVAVPGTKTLRREAVPLYTLLAESVVLSDATSATINRGGNSLTINLKNPNESATLILPGDMIKVAGSTSAAAEYFFVAGQVKNPGQKPYHAGLTLTQAILAAGGATNTAGDRVRVSRQRADGRVVSEEYDLKKIQDGKAIDPLLQRDDRVDVAGSN